jgi:glucosamine--fructose-6-phosphate aminotransferase (isomerizing)
MMRAEILDQPAVLARSLGDFRHQLAGLSLGASHRKIVLTGSGDSAIACCALEHLYRARAGVEVRALASLEASRYESLDRESLLVAVSVSGGVARTIEAVARARATGATTLAIVGRGGSELGRIAGQELLMPSPMARDTPHTRDYTLTLLALGVALEGITGTRFHELERWPDLAAGVLERAFAELGVWIGDAPQTIFLGAGPESQTARYAALKFWEGGAMRAIWDELEEFAHGSQLMAAPGHSVVMLAPGVSAGRAAEFLPGMAQMGLSAHVVTDDPGLDVPEAFCVPELGGPSWTPLLTCLPMQVLAYLAAGRRDLDVTVPMGGVPYGERYEQIHAEWTKRSAIEADPRVR